MRNQHLIKEAFACYNIIEPGDGTRYTAFYVPGPDSDSDNIYIAMGPGNHITGGYLMRRSSLQHLAARLYHVAYADKNLSAFLQVDHYLNYWNPHFKVMTKHSQLNWDTLAAVLFGLVMALSPAQEDTDYSLKFIGDVYRNRTVEVLATLVEWGIGPDSPQ